MKVYRQTDGQTDGQQTTGHKKSSLELSAQVSLKMFKNYIFFKTFTKIVKRKI